MLIRAPTPENIAYTPEQMELMRSQQYPHVYTVNVQSITSPNNPDKRMGNTPCPVSLTVKEFAAQVAQSCDIPLEDMLLQVSRQPVTVPDYYHHRLSPPVNHDFESRHEPGVNDGAHDLLTLPLRGRFTDDEVADLVHELNRAEQPAHPRAMEAHRHRVDHARAVEAARAEHQGLLRQYLEAKEDFEMDPGFLEEMRLCTEPEEFAKLTTHPGEFVPEPEPEPAPADVASSYEFTPWNARVAAAIISLMSAGMRRQSAHMVAREVALEAIPLYACLPKSNPPPTFARCYAGQQLQVPTSDGALSGVGGVYASYNTKDGLPPGPRMRLKLEWLTQLDPDAAPEVSSEGEMDAAPAMQLMHFLKASHRALGQTLKVDNGDFNSVLSDTKLLCNGETVVDDKIEYNEESVQRRARLLRCTLADLGVTSDATLAFVVTFAAMMEPQVMIGRPFTSCDGLTTVVAPATHTGRGSEWSDLTIEQVLRQEVAHS